MQKTMQENNKALALEAFETLFNQHDFARAEQYWSPDYIQRSARIPAGREGLFDLVRAIPAAAKYEPGVIMAEGAFVMMHGRYSGLGLPANWIAVDIIRMENGVFVEHWDVIQDEATREQSLSGNPMFGDVFPQEKGLK